MKSIQVSEVLERAIFLENDSTQDSYNKSYCHFVKYFKDKQQLTEHDLIIAANFTYGWMPTILEFKSDEFDLAMSIVNKAKQSKRISDEELLVLKKLMNNSIVGVSKILHFINPNVYAIWDSRVCNFLTGKAHAYKVQKSGLFWAYLDLCQKVAAAPEFEVIHRNYQEKVGYEITPMRTVEQIMFICSNNPIC